MFLLSNSNISSSFLLFLNVVTIIIDVFFLSCSFFVCNISYVSVSKDNNRSRDYPWEIYTLKELVHATNNFHNDNKIGEGGFGSVYWGRTSKGVEAIMSISSISFFLLLNFITTKRLMNRARIISVY